MKQLILALAVALTLIFAPVTMAEKSPTGKVYILHIQEAGVLETTKVNDLRDYFSGKIFWMGPVFTTKKHRTFWLIKRYMDGYDKDGNQIEVLWLRPAIR